MITKNSTFRRAASKIVLGTMLAITPTILEGGQVANNTATSDNTDLTKNLKLSEAQLLTYLGIGNTAPADAKTYVAGNGWIDVGFYEFLGAGRKTPFLTSKAQFGNWSYVIYKKQMADKDGSLLPVYDEIKKAVNGANSRGKRFLRDTVNTATAPARAVAEIGQIGTEHQKGPVQVGAETPGVGVGASGTATTTTKPPQNTAPNSTTAQPTTQSATVLTSTDPVENIKHMLTKDQLQTYFGIGDMPPKAPYVVKTWPESEGWKGEGIYISESFISPFLKTRKELGYTHYLLYGEGHRAKELAGEPLDPVIKDAMDRARGKSK